MLLTILYLMPVFKKPNPLYSPLRLSNSQKHDIESFHLTRPEVFVPSSILHDFSAEDEALLSREDVSFHGGKNRLCRISGNDNQFVLVSPIYSSTELAFTTFLEVNVSSDQIMLEEVESLRLDFKQPVEEIVSNSLGYFAISSSKSVQVFSANGFLDAPIANYTSPHGSAIKSATMNWFDAECAVLQSNSTIALINAYAEHVQIPGISDSWNRCNFGGHSSLLALSGESGIIELKDLRGVLTNHYISDKHVPFSRTNHLSWHPADPNILAISCDALNNSPEVRIYDIRYPQESTLRIHCDKRISFLEFAVCQSHLDRYVLFGSGHDGSIWKWETYSSKNNLEFSDGLLSLTDERKIRAPVSWASCITGQSSFPSTSNPDCTFLLNLFSDDSIECSLLSHRALGLERMSLNSEDTAGMFCNLGDIYESNTAEITVEERNPVSSLSLKGISRYLDVYWDESRNANKV